MGTDQCRAKGGTMFGLLGAVRSWRSSAIAILRRDALENDPGVLVRLRRSFDWFERVVRQLSHVDWG